MRGVRRAACGRHAVGQERQRECRAGSSGKEGARLEYKGGEMLGGKYWGDSTGRTKGGGGFELYGAH